MRLRLVSLVLALPIALAAPAYARMHRRSSSHSRSKKHHRHVDERPVATYTRAGLPNIQAHAAVVVDVASGGELFQKNPDEIRPIASISKLMAMMVVLDHHPDLSAMTTITDDDAHRARRGAKSRLPVGASVSNGDLLHAALIASDNRAVLALGHAVGLTPDAFAAEMTRRAHDLGLVHTGFGDPTGLDSRNVSTPRELAKMLMAALKYPLISEITRKGTYVAHAVGKKNNTWAIEYNNTDVMTRSSRYAVLGGKTGYTDLAGYCLAIAAKLDGQRDVAMVFLGASGKMTRFGDASRALTWITEKNPTVTAQKDAPAKPVGPPL